MTTLIDPAFIAALAALIAAIGGLIATLQTRTKVGATQRSVEHVHQKVDQATNGQHDELVADLGELKDRVTSMEREMHTVYLAFIELIVPRPEGTLRRRRTDRPEEGES